MCGIVGIIGFKASDKVGLIEKSLELLKHRGPDEHGVAMSNNWIMGHTRLSIVDLITGQQPLQNFQEGQPCEHTLSFRHFL